MELNINEINKNEILLSSPFEKITENSVPIKVIKKSVHFNESEEIHYKPINQNNPRQNINSNSTLIEPSKSKLSYEDILSKMGMFVAEGKLHLLDENNQHILPKSRVNENHSTKIQDTKKPQYESNPNLPKDSYIYNKFFKDQKPKNNIRKPINLIEYRNMLIHDILQKQRIKQLKSTKLIMPNNNLNAFQADYNLNKLFNFSKR